MKPPEFRARLSGGIPCHGIWRTLPGDALTEIVAQQGYDFQIFDLEHGCLSISDVESMVRINNAHGRTSIVRLGDRSPIAAQRALDSGAHGLVYPQVNSGDDVALLAENLAFAPRGRRGFNPFVAGFAYGAQREPEAYLPLLIPIVETEAGLTALGEICSHPSVDVVYLGAYDLSVQLGTPGEIESPVVLKALEAAIATCLDYRCAVGLMAGNSAALRKWSQAGVAVFLHGVDGGILRNAFTFTA